MFQNQDSRQQRNRKEQTTLPTTFYKAKLYKGKRKLDPSMGKYRYPDLKDRPAIILNSVGPIGNETRGKCFYVGSKDKKSFNQNLAYYGLIFAEKIQIKILAGGANQAWNIAAYRPNVNAKEIAQNCESFWIERCKEIWDKVKENVKKFVNNDEFDCEILGWNGFGCENKLNTYLKKINELYDNNSVLPQKADPLNELKGKGFKDVVDKTVEDFSIRKIRHILSMFHLLAQINENEKKPCLNTQILRERITTAIAEAENQVEKFEWEYPCILYFLQSLLDTIQDKEFTLNDFEKLIKEKFDDQFKPNFIKFILEECAKFYFFKGHDVFYSDKIIDPLKWIIAFINQDLTATEKIAGYHVEIQSSGKEIQNENSWKELLNSITREKKVSSKFGDEIYLDTTVLQGFYHFPNVPVPDFIPSSTSTPTTIAPIPMHNQGTFFTTTNSCAQIQYVTNYFKSVNELLTPLLATYPDIDYVKMLVSDQHKILLAILNENPSRNTSSPIPTHEETSGKSIFSSTLSSS